eukprot:5646190-Pyramimonas_sp.AAC.1
MSCTSVEQIVVRYASVCFQCSNVVSFHLESTIPCTLLPPACVGTVDAYLKPYRTRMQIESFSPSIFHWGQRNAARVPLTGLSRTGAQTVGTHCEVGGRYAIQKKFSCNLEYELFWVRQNMAKLPADVGPSMYWAVWAHTTEKVRFSPFSTLFELN